MQNDICQFFQQFSPQVAETAEQIFEITQKIMLPETKTWIDYADKMITFGTEKNMKGEICYIKPLKDSVNLGFFHGAVLNDPKNLLQGTGKRLRHIKFRSKKDIDADSLQELLKTALEEHHSRQSK